MTTDDFGERLAAERVRLGLTQLELGERVGKSPQAISNWENHRTCPRVPEFAKLDSLGFDVRWLLTGNPGLVVRPGWNRYITTQNQ